MNEGSNISVVLCRVRESGNVGSICRAMKTMGIEKLLLADCPAYEEEKVHMMAVHAYDLYENAVRYLTLESALADFSLSAGFSRRRGEKRKEASISLRDFVSGALPRAPAALALVFGNERDGLSDSELNHCSMAVHIPTSEACPSLNVAQAVQIVCYEFFASRLAGEESACKATAAARSIVEAKVSDIVAALATSGFFQKSDSSYVRRFLRDLCERAGASPTEVDYLSRIFLKTAALASGPSPRRRESGLGHRGP